MAASHVDLSPLAPQTLDVPDPILDELERQLPQEESPTRGFGEGPFDLRVILPRALDLTRVWKAAGKPVPTELDAILGGAKIPVLLNHGLTPFPHDGTLPRGVWGLGYEFELRSPVAHTISLVPDSQALTVADIQQDVQLGLDIGGKIALPAVELPVTGPVPGVSLTGARLEASTQQSMALSLRMKITLRKILAGPFGAGGAKWNLYRQDERLDQFHPLLQTITVPAGTTSLHAVVRTWATRKKLFGGREFWPYPDQEFEISLAGLGA